MTQELINEIIDLVNEQRDSQGMITKVDLMLKIKTLLETNFKNSGVLDGVSNRRELLIAFYANQNGGLNNTNKYSIEREVDKYLSNL